VFAFTLCLRRYELCVRIHIMFKKVRVVFAFTLSLRVLSLHEVTVPMQLNENSEL
jgi:hypothetical protein